MNKILCVFSMFLVTMLSAQTKTGVAGVVTDQEMDGEPLSFASVIVKGTSRGTTTDLHGKFDLNLEAGDYTLLVSFMGYEEKEIPVKVETGKRLQIEVGLNSAGVGLEEVVVQWNVNREAESVLLVVIDLVDLKDGKGGGVATVSLTNSLTTAISGKESNMDADNINSQITIKDSNKGCSTSIFGWTKYNF